MINTPHGGAMTKPGAGRFWPGAIIGLLALNVAVVAVTVTLASGDKSFSIEPDYYAKASNWNETARQRDTAAQRGWDAAVSCAPRRTDGRAVVSVSLSAAAGQERVPLDGAEVVLELFPQAAASRRQTVTASRAGAGSYQAEADVFTAGLWEVRVQIKRGPDSVTMVRTMLVGRQFSGGDL